METVVRRETFSIPIRVSEIRFSLVEELRYAWYPFSGLRVVFIRRTQPCDPLYASLDRHLDVCSIMTK